MNKKKLVVLSAFYDPYMSGAEQMVKTIVENLGDKYDITLITGWYDRKLSRVEDRRGFRLVRAGFGYKKLDKFFYPFIAAWTVRLFKPDILHAVMESYAGLALVLSKLFYSKAKTILTLQSGDLDDKRKQAKFYIRWIWKLIHRTPDKVTAISAFLANRAEQLGVEKENIFITPNGLDFSEVPNNVEKIKNRVIIAGRLSWEKAHKYLLQAWPKILQSVPEARLVIVGDGDERKNIEKIIDELNIKSTVELKGMLSHDKTLYEIKKSEIFVCPSLAEGLGNVFIEAQACGTPPIGTNVGGIPDIIKDKENGLLIEPKNSEQIADAIIELLQDNVLRNKLRNKGLETSQQFSWNNFIKKITVIYQDILK